MRAAVLVLLAACASSTGAGTPLPYTSGLGPLAVAPPANESCPLAIEGVSADIEHTGRGATVKLTAPPDQVMLLRARARSVTDAEGGLLGACPCAATADAGAPPLMETTVDDIEGGTRITETARDPDDARALRAILRTQLGRVHGGDCGPGPAR
jgi:hypothetical protein